MAEVKGHNKNVISFPESPFDILRAVSPAKRGIERPRPMAEELHNALSDYIQRYTWHPSQKIKELKDGRILFSMTASGKEEIKAWILSFGAKVKVLSPKSLREEIQTDLA